MSDKNDEIFEEEEIDNIIYLSDEDGNEVAFEFLDIVEYGGEEFVVLLPTDDDDGEVVILKVEAIDEEQESYVSVDDDATLQAVFDIFKKKFQDEFNFVD
jgi:Protein of unknown function (DUF1292).